MCLNTRFLSVVVDNMILQEQSISLILLYSVYKMNCLL